MIFVDQVSAAIPVLLLLTRSKVPYNIFLHGCAPVDAQLLRESLLSAFLQRWHSHSCMIAYSILATQA